MIIINRLLAIVSRKTLLFFLLLQLPVLSQIKIYSIEEAIDTALTNNRDITISKLNVNKAGAAVSEAFGYALPSLDLSGGFTHFLKKPKTSFPDFEALLTNATYNILFDEGVIPEDDSKYLPMDNKLQTFAQANNFQTDLTLTQVLFNSAVFEGIGASQIYYDLAKSELSNQVSKTVLSVKKSFYNVLIAKEVLKITQASFTNADDNFNNVKALYKEGMVSEFDRLQAEVRVENIRPALLQVENLLVNALNAFKITLGINQNDSIDVAGEFVYKPFENIDESALIDEALSANYDLKSLDLKKQVDKAFIQLDVAEYWPSLATFGNYTYAGSSDNWDYQNYSSFTVGLNLSINLWKGNRTKNKVEQSTISYKQTEEQYLLLKDYTTINVKSKILELKRVQSLLDVQSRTIEVAERAYNIAKIRYSEGAGSQLELQNADEDLRQARLNRVQSVHSYLIAVFELEQILGRTNPKYFTFYNELKD